MQRRLTHHLAPLAMAILAVATIAVLAPTTLTAQQTDEAADASALTTAEGLPDGWIMRLDRPDAGVGEVDFQVMEPGWHVKTGRAGAGIYWMPGTSAEGEFRLGATYHLFEPRSHPEAFGLFVGGEGLDGEAQSYLYFLVRQTGEYLIKQRKGEETETLVPWTAHDAVPQAPAGERGPTEYSLTVHAGPDQIEFLVDGTAVHAMDRPGSGVDGIVGLRVNHMLDLHIEEVTLD